MERASNLGHVLFLHINFTLFLEKKYNTHVINRLPLLSNMMNVATKTNKLKES